MSPEEEQTISTWRESLAGKIPVTCHVSGDARTERFKAFCEALSLLAPGVVVTHKKTDEAKAFPSIEIHQRLIYHAVPQGPELEPFLAMLSRIGNKTTLGAPGIEALSKNLKTPCFLKLFIAPECPFCPKMVGDLAPLALENELVKLTIIDGLLFPEMADPLGIKSAPTLLLDDRLRWTGQTPSDEIIEIMLNQDPSLLSAASIEALLGDGGADLVARMMMAEGKIFPAFVDTLIHDLWSVRLGAMVVMEEIIEHDKPLAMQCVELLWEKFPDLNQQVRGDVIYILGEAGTGDMIPRLESVLRDATDAETREAVKEALETIKK